MSVRTSFICDVIDKLVTRLYGMNQPSLIREGSSCKWSLYGQNLACLSFHCFLIKTHCATTHFWVIVTKKFCKKQSKLKINVHCTRGITPKHVKSGGLEPGRYNLEEKQRWRPVDNAVSDLTGSGIESQTYGADNNVMNHT